MSDTTDWTTGADGCDQFVDDGSDETLLMPESLKIDIPESLQISHNDLEPRPRCSRCAASVLFPCDSDLSSTLSWSPTLPVEQGIPV